jgi:hypothetical protein
MPKGLFGRVQDELEAREKTPGLSMADVLDLPDTLRQLVNWMMREDQVGLPQVMAHLGQDATAARATLATLVDKGFVREMQIHGETRYRVRIAPRRRRAVPLNIWQALDEKIEKEQGSQP